MTTIEAARLRAKAAESRKAAAESFERSDTDGCYSQWAHGLSADLAEARAGIADDNGLAVFTGLYHGDKRVEAKLVNGRYGLVWLLSEDAASRHGRKFIPHGANSRVQRSLGLTERSERHPAYICYDDNGSKGMAGMVNVRIVARRVYDENDPWHMNSRVDKDQPVG